MTGILERLGLFLRVPDMRPRAQIIADIEAELEAHITLKAMENERSGLPSDEALREARQSFGDSRRVLAECLDIQMKERNMMQRINVVLIVLLLAGLGADLWVGSRAQSGMRQDVVELRQTVASLASGLHGRERLALPISGNEAATHIEQRSVHVLGPVGRPGPISWRENLTMTRLISLAGDFRNFADQSKIRVIRNAPSGRQDIIVNFNEILSGEKPDLPLEVDDLIVVREALF